MSNKELMLALLLIVWGVIGGMIDTYTSQRFFPTKIKPPIWLTKYFLIWWLVIFVIILPFLMVYLASDYAFWVVKVFLTFGVLASVFWDLIFSKIWSGKWISDSCKTWFWVGKYNLGFDKKLVVPFHFLRLLLFLILFYFFFINRFLFSQE